MLFVIKTCMETTTEGAQVRNTPFHLWLRFRTRFQLLKFFLQLLYTTDLFAATSYCLLIQLLQLCLQKKRGSECQQVKDQFET